MLKTIKKSFMLIALIGVVLIYCKIHILLSDDVIKSETLQFNTSPARDDIILINQVKSNGCTAILDGNEEAIQKWRNCSSCNFPWRDITMDDDVINMASNCTELKKRYKFPGSEVIVTDEEINFPIAYSILAHENVNQILVLLSAIYRKHNIHCIHLDAEASPKIYQALSTAAQCFPNVFLSTQRHRVVYAHVSRLLADIACMKDLLAVPKTAYDWKYLINLCSQDFPLRTNLEIVRQLEVLRGFNSISGRLANDEETRERIEFVYEIQKVEIKPSETEERAAKTNRSHSPPPYNMTMMKNLAYNLYTRDFLKWALLSSKVGQALLDWSMDTFSPDEHFWLMLHAYPGAPGGSQKMTWFGPARHIKWWLKDKVNSCHGKWRHDICVFGAEDINELTKTGTLFVNKLDVTLDNTGPTCLRQWLDERSMTDKYTRRNTNPDRKPEIPPNSLFT